MEKLASKYILTITVLASVSMTPLCGSPLLTYADQTDEKLMAGENTVKKVNFSKEKICQLDIEKGAIELTSIFKALGDKNLSADKKEELIAKYQGRIKQTEDSREWLRKIKSKEKEKEKKDGKREDVKLHFGNGESSGEQYWKEHIMEAKVYQKKISIQAIKVETTVQIELAKKSIKNFSPEFHSQDGKEPTVTTGDWFVTGNGLATPYYIVTDKKMQELYKPDKSGKLDTYNPQGKRLAMKVKGPFSAISPSWQVEPLFCFDDGYVMKLDDGEYNLATIEDFEATFELVK